MAAIHHEPSPLDPSMNHHVAALKAKNRGQSQRVRTGGSYSDVAAAIPPGSEESERLERAALVLQRRDPPRALPTVLHPDEASRGVGTGL